MFITILFLSYVGCIEDEEEGDRGYGYGAELPPKVTRDIPIAPPLLFPFGESRFFGRWYKEEEEEVRGWE